MVLLPYYESITHLCKYFHLAIFKSSCASDSYCLREEFVLKTDSGYPKDKGVTLFTLLTPGNPLRYLFAVFLFIGSFVDLGFTVDLGAIKRWSRKRQDVDSDKFELQRI